MNNPVAVGYDGSSHSRSAVDVALNEARMRGSRLVILHSAVTPMAGMPPEVLAPWGDEGAARRGLQDMPDHGGGRGLGGRPDVPVETELLLGDTVGRQLVEKSRHCRLMVVGSRGRGGFKGLLLGSTSSQLAAHAHCPVLVARTDVPSPDGPRRGRCGRPLIHARRPVRRRGGIPTRCPALRRSRATPTPRRSRRFDRHPAGPRGGARRGDTGAARGASGVEGHPSSPVRASS